MVFDHLHGSPYHAFSKADATIEADHCRCEAWATPEAEDSEQLPFLLGRCPDRESAPVPEGGAGAGKGKGGGKYGAGGKKRPTHAGSDHSKRRAIEGPQAPSSVLAYAEAAASSAVVPVDLKAQIKAQTRGAYVFVKAR